MILYAGSRERHEPPFDWQAFVTRQVPVCGGIDAFEGSYSFRGPAT